MKKNDLIITVVVALVVGAGAFFMGMKYQQGKTPFFGQRAGGQFGAGTGQNGQNRFGRNMRPVSGEILSTDSQTITVKMLDGSSKIVILSQNTKVNKATVGSKNDLKQGVTVAVFGTENTDGSVTADNIQLNPQARTGNNGQN